MRQVVKQALSSTVFSSQFYKADGTLYTGDNGLMKFKYFAFVHAAAANGGNTLAASSEFFESEPFFTPPVITNNDSEEDTGIATFTFQQAIGDGVIPLFSAVGDHIELYVMPFIGDEGNPTDTWPAVKFTFVVSESSYRQVVQTPYELLAIVYGGRETFIDGTDLVVSYTDATGAEFVRKRLLGSNNATAVLPASTVWTEEVI